MEVGALPSARTAVRAAGQLKGPWFLCKGLRSCTSNSTFSSAGAKNCSMDESTTA